MSRPDPRTLYARIDRGKVVEWRLAGSGSRRGIENWRPMAWYLDSGEFHIGIQWGDLGPAQLRLIWAALEAG